MTMGTQSDEKDIKAAEAFTDEGAIVPSANVEPDPDPPGGAENEPLAPTSPDANPRLAGLFTDRDVLSALAKGSITREDARDWLASNTN